MSSIENLAKATCAESTINHSIHDTAVNFIHDTFWYRFYCDVKQDLRYPSPAPPTWMELQDVYYCGIVVNEMVIAFHHRCKFQLSSHPE